MKTESWPAQRAELKTDIAAARAELGGTLEALAAKTQITSRAETAAKSFLVHTKDWIFSTPSWVLNKANSLVRGISARTTPARRRLSVTAVLAGGLTAFLAALRHGTKGDRL